MKRKILFIINPISGIGSRSALQATIVKKLRQAGIPYIIYPSVASGDYEFLKPVIREEGITDIVIAGGDGTISQVVAQFLHSDLTFGIIPCGSGNGLAFGLKIPPQFSRAIDVIIKGKTMMVDGFFINGRFACMLGGIGADAQVAHEFASQKKRGLLTYLKLSLKHFFSMKPYPFRLRLRDSVLQLDAYFISVANSNQFGNNFTIAPRASLSDGLLDVVIVTRQNKARFILETLKQLAGLNALRSPTELTKADGILYFQAEKLEIENPEEAPLHIDGEPVEPAKVVRFGIIKQCFRVSHPG